MLKEDKIFYSPNDLESFKYDIELGNPGEYPFTRGIYSDMYRSKQWTMRQYAGYGDARETNQRFKYLLEEGQTGLSCAFDLPTQLGYDSDNRMSEGEVGKVGVAISCLEDLEEVFGGIPLDKISVSMTINATAIILLAMYIVVAEKQGIHEKELSGTIQNDILKEYIARGNFIFPIKPSMRLVCDIFEYCSNNMPKWNTISISGYHIREKGSTAVQELAFTFANAIAYIEMALKRGLSIDDFASRLSFFFNSHNNFFEEIAKFRAGRRIWAKIMKNRFKASSPKSWMLRFHTQTAGSTLTAQQPENNIVRVALQALASVLGGTQSLHTNSYDEAASLPSEKAVRIALRTQQILGYESGISDTADPLGGSYYIEFLTNKIEEEVVSYLDKIDKMGGAIACVENGFFEREIEESAYRYQKNIEENKQLVVGINSFRIVEEEKSDALKADEFLFEERKRKLNTLREKRDKKRVKEVLERIKETASSKENLISPIKDAVREGAMLGEICDGLREVFGEYKKSERNL